MVEHYLTRFGKCPPSMLVLALIRNNYRVLQNGGSRLFKPWWDTLKNKCLILPPPAMNI